MTDATQPRVARGTKLIAGVLASALFALLAFAPFASAAPDPLASGTTTVTLKKGVVKAWKKRGVKLSRVAPATLKGNKATFTVTGGSLDPTNGLGTVNLGGGLKFKAGKKSATVKSMVLETSTNSLTANVAGKKMKMAKIGALASARNGFGVNLGVGSLKLTKGAAKQLNKKLGFTGKKKNKGHKRATVSKTSSPPFKANQVLGSASAETQPSTVTVLPTGNATLKLAAAALQKLATVGPEVPPASGEHPFAVKLATIAPTSIVDPGPPPTVAFPITGGTMGPTATAGVLQTAGGLKLTQNLEALGPNGKGETTLTLGNVWVDLGTKTATVEVTITNPKTPEANLGNLGRVSIADISLTGATVTSDPATRTVSVQNASATLQALTAATLNAVFVEPIEGKGKGTFAAGDPLGTFSFTAQTQ